LIVDGYNLMHADDELEALMRQDLEAARELLVSKLEEYCAREERTAEIVFDAAGRGGPAASEQRAPFLKVTYTAEGQSADSYIEKLAYREPEGSRGAALLITGDYDQQKIASGAGLLRMSSREFVLEMRRSHDDATETIRARGGRPRRSTLAARIPEDVRAALESLRKRE
jgi:predicted RNA-binding protein with PIN domain